MIISYSDGRSFEAALLTRTGSKIRMVIQGEDDVTEFSRISGVWVSPDCEVVTIPLASPTTTQNISESDCICSHEEAAKLLRLLFSGSPDEDAAEAPAPDRSRHNLSYAHLPV
jgi:hypothetical protein